MMMATLLGMVFAVSAGRYPTSRTTLLGAGMVYGAVVWLLIQHVIWPLVDDAAAQAFTAWVFAVGHLLYGMVTAIVVAPPSQAACCTVSGPPDQPNDRTTPSPTPGGPVP